MKLAKISVGLLLVAVAGCGEQSASQYATETSVVAEVTETSEPEATETTETAQTTDLETTTTTETTIETTTTTTTTTTMPPTTTTTVLDKLCVKLTQCQVCKLSRCRFFAFATRFSELQRGEFGRREFRRGKLGEVAVY